MRTTELMRQPAVFRVQGPQRERSGRFVAPVVALVGMLLVWKAVVRLGGVDAFLLPSPSRILGVLIGQPGFIPRMHDARFRRLPSASRSH